VRRLRDPAPALPVGRTGCASGSSAPTACPAARSRTRGLQGRGWVDQSYPWRDTRRRSASSPAAGTGASACSR
jgi:hypothetical protein